MFEKIKFKLYKNTGIFTEYQSIRHKQDRMSKNHQDYEHFLAIVNNAVDEIVSLLEKMEKSIREEGDSSRYISNKEFEIERIKHKLKITESDNECNKYMSQLRIIEDDLRNSIQRFVSSLFNNIKNGTYNNSLLINQYITFLTYLRIVIDNNDYEEFSDNHSFEIINKLINGLDLSYNEIEELKNHLLNVQSRARLKCSKSSNDIYAFNSSDKVRIYDALDKNKRR